MLFYSFLSEARYYSVFIIRPINTHRLSVRRKEKGFLLCYYVSSLLRYEHRPEQPGRIFLGDVGSSWAVVLHMHAAIVPACMSLMTACPPMRRGSPTATSTAIGPSGLHSCCPVERALLAVPNVFSFIHIPSVVSPSLTNQHNDEPMRRPGA